MKIRLVLLISLALNLALAAAWAFRWQNRTARPVDPSVQASATSPAIPAIKASPVAVTPAAATLFPFHWRAIESDDYHRYVSNLQAAGCPPRTIRDIIVADLDELYATKLVSAPTNPPAWLNADRRRAHERGRAARVAALKAEKRALVRELIGYEWDNRANEIWHEDFMAGLILGFLPDSKAMQLMAVFEKYEELSGNVKDAADGILIDEDRAKFRMLYDNLVAEMSQLLTPAEREELELRIQVNIFLWVNDFQWDGVTITGVEMREFVRLSKIHKDAFRDESIGLGNLPQAELATRKAAFEKQVATLLGSARFAEYQRAQDPGFREGWSFAKERKLPAATAIKIYGARQTAEQQADEINRDPALTGEQRTAAFASLKTTTATKLSSALGDAYRDYQDGPGQWLEGLAAPELKAEGGPP